MSGALACCARRPASSLMAITSDAGRNGAGVVATYIRVVVLAAQDAPDPLDPVFLFEAVSRYAGQRL